GREGGGAGVQPAGHARPRLGRRVVPALWEDLFGGRTDDDRGCRAWASGGCVFLSGVRVEGPQEERLEAHWADLCRLVCAAVQEIKEAVLAEAGLLLLLVLGQEL